MGRLWPHTIPAVRQLLTEGLDLGQASVLVGDNGTGKSTIVEALAAAYGLNPEGGSAGAMHQTAATESPLSGDLRVERGAGASKDGFFLVLAALPGARILELDGDGFHETVWEDLSLVVDQRHFLCDPQAFLRHLR